MVAIGTSGFNGQLSGVTGSRAVRVMAIRYGLDIESSADEESRSRRAFYPLDVDESQFQITLGFVSWEERERLNSWLATFMDGLATDRVKSGLINVRCPMRKLDKVGVPKGPLQYGEGILDVGYSLDLTFVGASDALDTSLGAKASGASYFKQSDVAFANFYPSATKVSGAPLLNESATFDGSTAAAEGPAAYAIPNLGDSGETD